MPKLNFLTVDVGLSLETSAVLPVYKGSTFRGALGHSLRRAACALPSRRECPGCPVAKTCPYKFLFEPSDLPTSKRFKDAPRPFVLFPPETEVQTFSPGDALSLKLTLFGAAVEYLPYFALALTDIGRAGIGKRRAGKFRLTGIYSGAGTVYDPGTGTLYNLAGHVSTLELDTPAEADDVYDILVDFVTPARLTDAGRIAEGVTLPILARAVFRRVSALGALYCRWTEIPHYDGLLEAAGAARVVNDKTNWFEWERYSSRQDRKMGMGGLIGPITFGNVPGVLVPWLSAGSVVHVGKGATFGLGGYRLEARSEKNTD